jgi:hypothetical protein
MDETETNLGANVSCENSSGNSLVLLIYGTEELETRDNLLLGVIGLDDCADDGHIYVLRADIMR